MTNEEKDSIQQKKRNKPHPVRKSLIDYLEKLFPYGEEWIHPTTGIVYDSATIKLKLEKIKSARPESYKALWAMWTTKSSRNFLADRFYCSPSTIKRRWDEGLDLLMLLLMYPELEPNNINYNFYGE